MGCQPVNCLQRAGVCATVWRLTALCWKGATQNGLEVLRGRQVQLEIESGPPVGTGLDLQLGAHRLDQAARDGQPQPRPRQVVAAPAAGAAERLEQVDEVG